MHVYGRDIIFLCRVIFNIGCLFDGMSLPEFLCCMMMS